MAKAQPRTNNPKLSKRRSFSAWLKRKVAAGGIRKFSPEYKGRVFGVPLVVSIQYAESKINYENENTVVYQQAGSIPTIVAKTGRFLKDNALHTEGIFRIQGSYKRIATLQEMFDQPSQMYGEHVDWTNYTVHDAATLLRRYLNQLPNPVITHEYYQLFRDVMNDHSYGSTEERIRAYQELIQKLPTPHQHLLLYLLDMLNLFAQHADENRMDASNLAAVFCPAILSHPSHNTAVHYKISQRVIEFLIEFQALFTIQSVLTNNEHDEGIVVAAAEGAEAKVPPIDMDQVRRANSVRHWDGDELIDSGTDVKTPYTAAEKDKEIPQIDTPIATPTVPEPSTSLPSSPHPAAGESSCKLSKSTNLVKRSPYCIFFTIRVDSPAVNIVGGLAALVTIYMLYQYMTLGRMLQGGLLLGGIAAYSSSTSSSSNKAGPPPTPPPHKVQNGKLVAHMQEEEQEDGSSADGQESLVEDDDGEQDRAIEEKMMQDESIMSEWGHLLHRSWKTDPSTPLLHSRYSSNSRPDYFSSNRVDSSSGFSFSSRFAEQDSSDEGSYNDSEVDQDELDRIWREIEQLEKDRKLAEKLQREEQEAECQRDLSTNPFLMSPISPKNTDKETWKIATRPRP